MIKVPQEHRQQVGKILKDKRLVKNMSLKDVGEKIQMDPGNLSRIENGLISVNYDKLCRIAIILDAPEVFTLTGLPMPEYFIDKLFNQDQNNSKATVKDNKDSTANQNNIKSRYKVDPFDKFALLKPYPDLINDFNFDLMKSIISEVGDHLNLNSSFFYINPWLRELITDRIDLATSFVRINNQTEQEVILELAKSDTLSSLDAMKLIQKIKTHNADQSFWLGYFQGILNSFLTLDRSLKNHGLYWFLAGFVDEPADALLLETFHDAFKDKTSEEKEKLIDAFKGFLELYQAMNSKKPDNS